MSHTKIGFWYSPSEPSLPKPQCCPEPWPKKKKFLAALTEVEQVADEVSYRGFSTCRVCTLFTGSTEFSYGKYCWPVGLRHYVQQHNVVLPQEFVDFIIAEASDDTY